MVKLLGYASLDDLIDAVVPEDIRLRRPLDLPPGRGEREVLQALRGMADQNRIFRTHIGMGYYGTFVPQVIQRNILENPGWYTAYTPYQAEIAQGRLEALLNFQTMVADLTGLPIANASLLDEATAAAEAMALTHAVAPRHDAPVYLVDADCHPQTVAVVVTRAEARGVAVKVQSPEQFEFGPGVIGCLVQYPATDGALRDFRATCTAAHAARALVTAATDLLALTLLVPPANGARTSRSATASVSACRSGTAGRTRRSSRRRTSTSVTCPAASSAYRRTGMAVRRSAWRCRPGNSTSAARRRRATSARRRCSWPSWRACTPCTTGPTGCAASRSGRTTAPSSSPTRCAACATGSCMSTSSTRSASRSSAGPCRASWTRPGRARSTCGSSPRRDSAWRSTRPPAWATWPT